MNVIGLILSVVVSATLDSTHLILGDQQKLHLQATLNETEQVLFPQTEKELIAGIEIVNHSKIDTTRLANGDISLRKELTITSFQDSLFVLPALPFVAGEDTLYTESLTLNVIQPFAIDTTQAITDIKPIYKAPIWWWGIFRWVLLAVLLIALGIGVYFLVRYIQRNKQNQGLLPLPAEPLRPADEVALEKLDQIKESKIWQEGRVKDYYTDLTDVVREYIARRYQVQSQEQTSEEILRDVKPFFTEKKDLYEKLSSMLRLADLVKFAKWNTLAEENEAVLRNAYNLVQETKEKNEENPADNQQS